MFKYHCKGSKSFSFGNGFMEKSEVRKFFLFCLVVWNNIATFVPRMSYQRYF